MKKPTLLVVDDEAVYRNVLKRNMEEPSLRAQNETGLNGFEVNETARTADEARTLLWNAKHEKRTIDILWLDLGINANDPDVKYNDDPNVGIGVLNDLYASELNNTGPPIVGNIVIGSGKAHKDTLQKLIRTQVVQYFVPKPFHDEVPFRTAVDAYRSWQRRKWHEYKQKRLIRWSAEAARLGISNMTQSVTNGVGRAVTEMRKLVEVIEQSYYLNANVDREHPVCRQCAMVNEAVANITRDCAEERQRRSFLDEPEAEPSHQSASALLDAAEQNVSSGLAAKVIRIEKAQLCEASVDLFTGCALMLLEEVLCGAIEETPPDGVIEMSVDRSPSKITFTMQDSAPPLSPRDCEAIHVARHVLPPGGRAWGLALAQYAALNVGARLQVSPSDIGNIVRLSLPLATQP
jgi:response regulator of citrate/malate metabolism